MVALPEDLIEVGVSPEASIETQSGPSPGTPIQVEYDLQLPDSVHKDMLAERVARVKPRTDALVVAGGADPAQLATTPPFLGK